MILSDNGENFESAKKWLSLSLPILSHLLNVSKSNKVQPIVCSPLQKLLRPPFQALSPITFEVHVGEGPLCDMCCVICVICDMCCVIYVICV